jgi:hypothetical protein
MQNALSFGELVFALQVSQTYEQILHSPLQSVNKTIHSPICNGHMAVKARKY